MVAAPRDGCAVKDCLVLFALRPSYPTIDYYLVVDVAKEFACLQVSVVHPAWMFFLFNLSAAHTFTSICV